MINADTKLSNLTYIYTKNQDNWANLAMTLESLPVTGDTQEVVQTSWASASNIHIHHR